MSSNFSQLKLWIAAKTLQKNIVPGADVITFEVIMLFSGKQDNHLMISMWFVTPVFD